MCVGRLGGVRCRFAVCAFAFGRRVRCVMRGRACRVHMLPLPALAPPNAPSCVGACGGLVVRRCFRLRARGATSSCSTGGYRVAGPAAHHRVVGWHARRIRRFLYSSSAVGGVQPIIYGEDLLSSRLQSAYVWPAVYRLRHDIGAFGGSRTAGLATRHRCKRQIKNLRAC